MRISVYIHRLQQYLKHLVFAKSIYSIHSPFLFQFVRECLDKNNHYYCFDDLDQIRKQVSKDATPLEYTNIGASSNTLHQHNIPVKKIIEVAVTPKKYSELYYRIINFLQARTILELGTSLGINTMYLARSTTGRVITIEGQKSLHEWAVNLFQQNKMDNITAIHAYFDEVLPELIKQIAPIDVVFIDGNHTYRATKHYYSLLKTAMNQPSVMIIDDIHWSSEMTRAWKEIIHDESVNISIDLYRCGILIFNKNIAHPYRVALRY